MLAAAAILAPLTVSGVVYADADDAAWIAKCVKDNAREGQQAATVSVYCACMNGKMSDGETLSITAWEKKNPAAMAACEKEAGWK
ncbi:MAG: hypothetical protein HQL60_02375 [Magnetococcales bacterium]|nr:hypothetical protein [Magnetococcales bacterium]